MEEKIYMNIKYYYHSPLPSLLYFFQRIAVLGDSVSITCGSAITENGLLLLLNDLFEIGPYYTIKGRFPTQSILN